jgi:glycosyltransferase A (GT-A) superfamily protein (DUF2064 family)
MMPMLLAPKDTALAAFVKNLVPGKVKPEIEKETDAQYACKVYEELLVHCRDVMRKIKNVDTAVFYYSFLDEADTWGRDFQRYKQIGRTIGARVENCFELLIEKGYKKVILIRADCPELDERLLNNALKQLDTHDVVLGPEAGKGFYLVGTKALHETLLLHDDWCEPEFILELMLALKNAGLTYHIMPTLKAVNTLADWQEWTHKVEK